jgi:hypothetical protein
MKKTFDYFSTLARQAQLAAEAARVLRADVFAMEQAAACAKACATLHRTLATAAAADFLPPLEREDLLAVSRALCGFAAGAASDTQITPAHAELAAQAVELLPTMKKNSAKLLALVWQLEDAVPGYPGGALPAFAAAMEACVVKNI